MSNHRVFGLMAMLLTSACTTLPALNNSVPVSAVVHDVQCELQSTVSANISEYPWLKNWAAGFGLTLQITETGSATPQVALTGPIQALGTYGFGIGAGLTGTATRTATLKFTVSLKDLAKYDCTEGYDKAVLLGGNLGITEWVQEVLNSHQPDDTFSVPDTIGHTIEFVVQGGASLTPSYVLVRSQGNGTFNLQRSDTNTLDVALTDATPPPPQKVIIVGNEPTPGAAEHGLAAPPSMRPTILPPALSRSSPIAIPRVGKLVAQTPISVDARRRLDDALYQLQLQRLFAHR
jgi:hypothetical protein